VGFSAVFLLGAAGWLYVGHAVAQKKDESHDQAGWVEEIEKIFIRSEDCKQCHDRHYEEWKGAREQTPDLKVFGRVDAALLHGTSLESPVFRTVFGVWLQTSPTREEKQRCLSCHIPSVTVFPQYVDKIASQVLSGKVQVEGIGCSSCHLINETAKDPSAPAPTFKLNPGKTLYGPYSDPEENLVHPAAQSDLYRSVSYCASCHFDKVKDVTRRDLPGEILQGTVCQDCHMEPSTGSSTSKRGALTRPIGRHWFRGVVVPGIMLKNRNLQAEWMPRVDIEATASGRSIEGTVLIRVGSLPHSFPDGDPVLKQFFVTITAKDAKGIVLSSEVRRFGLSFEQVARGPFPEPFIKGGTTRRVPFTFTLPEGAVAASVEAVLTYALIPEPSADLLAKYLATLPDERARTEAVTLLKEYSQPRLLTFRTRAL
jgi:nitrate/TMAO reductase-like tetraheme cytochrome c subunit